MSKRQRTRLPGGQRASPASPARTAVLLPSQIREKHIPLAEIKAAQTKDLPGLDAEERARLIENRKGKKTVIIMGWAEKTRHLVPWDDLAPDVEVWSLNETYNDPSRFLRMYKITRWFQIHKEWDFNRSNNHNDPNHADWLKTRPGPSQPGYIPIYMVKKFDYVPASEAYPLEEIVASYGPNAENLRDFQSTAACMVALAIHEDFRRIEAYGIEMTGGADYMRQRVNFQEWLGVAMGKGIECYAPPQSDIFAPRRLYGFEQEPRVNLTHVELWRSSYHKSMDDTEKEIIALAGRRNEIVARLGQSGTNPGTRERLLSEKEAIENELLGLTAKAAYARGNENMAAKLLKEISALGEMYLKFGRDGDGRLVAESMEDVKE